MEVIPVSNATTVVTIEKLLSMFTIHGLPRMIVSDNGPAQNFLNLLSRMALNTFSHLHITQLLTALPKDQFKLLRMELSE